MNAMLLLSQCDSIVTKACGALIPVIQETYEAGTNCKDVAITKVICCTIVSVTAIIVLGSLLWGLMDHLFRGCQEKKKQKYEVAEKERKQQADLQDKLLGFLEKSTTKEEYNSELDKFFKTPREIDSEECQYYVKAILSLISKKAIPDYPQKTKVD